MKNLWLAACLVFAAAASAQSPAEFGKSVERALNERDRDALTRLIDVRAFGSRVAKIHGFKAGEQEAFIAGMQSTGLSKMMSGYLQVMEQSQGTAKFMRATNGSPARALVRIELGDSGFDYLEYVVETKNGRTAAVDWFQLSTGELMSVTLGGITQLLGTRDRGLVGRLLGVENVDEKAIDLMRQVGVHKNAGRYDQALATMQKLPGPLANSRVMLTFQASMAMFAKNDEEYGRILARLAEKYSDHPATAFVLLDHYVITNNLPSMVKSLDTIEKRVGIDGVTRQLRASAYYSAGDFASCLRYAEDSIRLEPERMDGYDVRASALVGLGRYADAVAQYKALEKKFGLAFTREIFTSDATFAKFVQSPAFRGWLKK